MEVCEAEEVGRAEGIGDDEMGREGGGGVEVADVDIGRAVRVARGWSLGPVADRGGGEGPWRGCCCAWPYRCRSGDGAVDECRISGGSGGVECPLARRRSGFRCTMFCSLAIRSDIYSPGRSGRTKGLDLASKAWVLSF